MASGDDHNFADKSCSTGGWYTPAKVLDPIRCYFGGVIPLDPCTLPTNPTEALEFFTPEDDGLAKPWGGYGGVFVNPPYGVKNRFHDWVSKIHEEAENGEAIIALLPCGSRFETRYWQEDILNEFLDALCFIKGRVPFEDETGKPHKNNTYGSLLYGFGVDVNRFTEAFWELGRVFAVKLQ